MDELADRLDLEARSYLTPAAQYPEVDRMGQHVRLTLRSVQVARLAQVLGAGSELPLGMELAAIGVRVFIAAEMDSVSPVHLCERDTESLASKLEAAVGHVQPAYPPRVLQGSASGRHLPGFSD